MFDSSQCIRFWLPMLLDNFMTYSMIVFAYPPKAALAFISRFSMTSDVARAGDTASCS